MSAVGKGPGRHHPQLGDELQTLRRLRAAMAEQHEALAVNRVELRMAVAVLKGIGRNSQHEPPALSRLLANVRNLVLRRAYVVGGRRSEVMLFFGADAPALLGRPERSPHTAEDWYRRIHPADRAAYRQAEVDRELRQRGSTMEYRYLDARTGTFRWARETTGSPCATAPGSWLLDSYIQDITEHKRLEDDLRASEKSYRAVVEDQSEYIRRFDRAGRLTFVNGAFCQLMRRSREELLGADLLGLLPASAARRMRRRLSTLTSACPTVSYELECARPGGPPGWQEWTDRAIFTEAGEVQEYQSVGRDITERKHAERQARYLLQHDPLTDLPNRALLEAHLRQALKHAGRARQRAAVLLLDLDGFKQVNDRHGHQTGDRLLRTVGQRLRGNVRASDLVARVGGDEFAVILPTLDGAAAAEALASKLVAALARPFAIGGEPLPLAASGGIALFPDHAREPRDLLRAADVALYRAKAEGRNTARLYAPAMAAVVSAQRELERDLRAAPARRELELFYQPRLDLRSPHKIAVEALMRWRRPGRGVVLPEAFLNVAQAIGLSPQLDRWAIEHACRQAARWRQAGMVTKIAVNLCGRQASEPQLAEELAEILEQTRLPPQSLELELTERAVIDAGSETTTDCLQRVSDLGVSLAIDDFGSGFSSFAYLRRLPVQTIKIDGSFIAQIGRNRADETIIRAIIDLCHGLGKRVVGEGVETGRQLAFLAAHGCDEVQGFLFCRPLPASETEDYLARPWLRAARRGGTQPTLVTAGSALSGRS